MLIRWRRCQMILATHFCSLISVDSNKVRQAFENYQPDVVMHLRSRRVVLNSSIDGAAPFIETNIVGTLHITGGGRRILAGVADRQAREFSISSMSRPTRSLAPLVPMDTSRKQLRTHRARPTRHRRPPPIISCVVGITLTDCRFLLRTAPTTMVLITFLKSSFP